MTCDRCGYTKHIGAGEILESDTDPLAYTEINHFLASGCRGGMRRDGGDENLVTWFENHWILTGQKPPRWVDGLLKELP